MSERLERTSAREGVLSGTRSSSAHAPFPGKTRSPSAGADRSFSPGATSNPTWVSRLLPARFGAEPWPGRGARCRYRAEIDITISLTRLLRRAAYRILTAQTAAEAFELLALNEVQVIISVPDAIGARVGQDSLPDLRFLRFPPALNPFDRTAYVIVTWFGRPTANGIAGMPL